MQSKPDRLTSTDISDELIPGLPNDVSATCLALVGRSGLRDLAIVSRRWRSFLVGGDLQAVRESLGLVEELLHVLVSTGNRKQWNILDSSGRIVGILPPMPGPNKSGFGVAVLGDKILVAGGFSVIANRIFTASSDVFQFDPCLNSWSKLPEMNEARYSFAFAAVNGKVYAVGGYGRDGYALSTAEVYDPRANRWTFFQGIQRPRYSAFAFSFNNSLHVMGGRSTTTVGSADCVEVYDPDTDTWRVFSGPWRSAMVTGCVAVGNRVFCLDWKDPKEIRVFGLENCSWESIRIPGGSNCVGHVLGSMDGKLLLFPMEPGADTLRYDPSVGSGSGWDTCGIRPPGSCSASVTTKA
ncbi:PREDICTED: F-box/kelch-repeat protein At1g67480-like [Tarenaya hassleriana]|uniref:F-box/kelch-repeat protein At1g67480-like n=1 Tax=Tarenaya hassleriana TaxID=28532 RepID=UPI00053C6B3A|nr:PREDICTED: F-box/kelch-repeat protein At1g67480-like [Tarenaya hassleriana]